MELPEGWGDLLLSLTNPLIEGIPLGMTSAMIYNYTTHPSLVLLLKLLVAYTIFAKRSRKDDAENAIITRGDSIEMEKIDAYFWSKTSNAQELWDVLKLMPRLRNGGTRLLPRLISGMKQILDTEL